VALTEPASNGPAFGTGLNGGPCLVGNAGSVLSGNEAALLALWTGSAGLATHSLLALFQLTSVSGSQGAVCSVGDSAAPFTNSSTLEHNSIADSSNCFTYARTPAVGNLQWFGGTPTTSVVAICMRFNGTVPTLRVAGSGPSMTLTAASTGTPPGAIAAPDRFSILARARQDFPGKFSGNMGPILLYGGVLSDANADKALTGMRRWYGLT
jgi:hypothetical protein